MNLRIACSIFRLKNRVSMQELNRIFRNLVKKYHPDKLPSHTKWAHERMTEINEAYELLIKRAIEQENKEQSEPKPGGEQTEAQDHTDYVSPTPAIDPHIEQVFYPMLHDFFDGLGIYYQYGLEVPAYRSEGVRRFRYREAMKLIVSGRDGINTINKQYHHPIIHEAARFSRLCVADIDMGAIHFQQSPIHSKYDRQFSQARTRLDAAIKDLLFPEMIPHHLRGKSFSNVYSCYKDFVVYMNLFEAEKERRNLGILQMARYDAFIGLVRLRNEGVIRF